MLRLLIVSSYPRLAACKSVSTQVSVSRPVIASYLDLLLIYLHICWLLREHLQKLYTNNSLFLTDSAIGCGLFVELRCCVRKSFGDKYRLRSFKRSSVLSLNKVMTWLTGFHLPAIKAINPSCLP